MEVKNKHWVELQTRLIFKYVRLAVYLLRVCVANDVVLHVQIFDRTVGLVYKHFEVEVPDSYCISLYCVVYVLIFTFIFWK